jgi:hypothetical protein
MIVVLSQRYGRFAWSACGGQQEKIEWSKNGVEWGITALNGKSGGEGGDYSVCVAERIPQSF